MPDAIAAYFNSESYMPHGHCFLWEPGIFWVHLLADIGIVIAYYSIPFALLYFVRKRKDLPLKSLFWLFSLFIALCGTTHLFSIWVLWNPDYAIEGILKAMTAIASLLTVAVILKLMPLALLVASPAQLAQLKADLAHTIAQREQAEQYLNTAKQAVEEKMAARLREIEASNERPQKELQERREAERELTYLLAEMNKLKKPDPA